MNAKVVTTKPEDGVIEYAIYDGETLVSHGHQVAFDFSGDYNKADLQAAVDAAAFPSYDA